MRYAYDAVATTGEYKDKNGETKKRYTNIGKVFEGDDGRLSLKLDSIPVGPEWSGWVAFYEPKPREGQRPPQQSAHNQAKSDGYAPPQGKGRHQDVDTGEGDDPPF